MSEHYTENGRNQLWAIFNYMDDDHSGKLNSKEFKKFVLVMGTRLPRGSTTKDFIKDCTGGLKELDFETFMDVLWINYFEGAASQGQLEEIFDSIAAQWGLGAAPPIHPSFTDDQCTQLAQVFARLDRDRSGALDKKELRKFVEALGSLGNREATQSALNALKGMVSRDELDFISFLDFFWANYGYQYESDWDSYNQLINWVEAEITGGNYWDKNY